MHLDLVKYVVDENISIKEALIKVDNNQYGFVMICNKDKKVVGLATDGDIRRALINGISIEQPIKTCTNYDFLYADNNSSREVLIKKLDSRIKFIPILDSNGKLHSFITKNNFPLEDEKEIYVRSIAPVRVSFGGGGSDLTYFFENDKGAVINSTISLYSHCVMKLRNDNEIVIYSHDLESIFAARNLNDALSKESKFGLIKSILDVVKPNFGFEMNIHSDFPLGSGLGGSATVTAAILGCFNMYRKDPWNQYELAEIAFQAERLHLGIAGGWQDQYASVFGGFNFIEFNETENIVNPIRIHNDITSELEESLVLCGTNLDHNSGNIHEDQKLTLSSNEIRDLVRKNVKLTYETRNYLLRGQLLKFGECLNNAWQLKKNFSKKISNKFIDDIYEGALNNGATGGKLLGAGGGGYLIFYVSPFNRFKLINYLQSKNLTIQPFRFEPEGMKAWKYREGNTASIK